MKKYAVIYIDDRDQWYNKYFDTEEEALDAADDIFRTLSAYDKKHTQELGAATVAYDQDGCMWGYDYIKQYI